MQISLVFASVSFGDSLATASFLRCKFRSVPPSVRPQPDRAAAAVTAAAAVAAVRPTVRSRSHGRSRSRRNRSRRRPSAGRPLQIHERLDTVALGFVVVSFSGERERRVLVVWVNCRGKVAPSLDVRSGGVPSLICFSASLRCAPRGANLYATDRFRAAAEPTVKIYGPWAE